MSTEHPYEVKKVSDSFVLVLSKSYETPLSYLGYIEEDLNTLEFTGKVLFDLLLCDGNVYNRFAEGYFKDGEIDYSSMRVVDHVEVSDSILHASNSFYKANEDLLERSYILLDEDKRTLVCS